MFGSYFVITVAALMLCIEMHSRKHMSPSGVVVSELAREERESGGMFRTGAITPDGLIDEDFEEELGSPSEENPYSDPESEFRDIAKYGIVQVAGMKSL